MKCSAPRWPMPMLSGRIFGTPGYGSKSFRSTSGIPSSAQALAVSSVVCRLMTPCHFLLRSQRGSVSEMAWSSWKAVQMWWVRSKWAIPFSMAVLSSKRVRKIRSTWGFFFTPRLCKHPIGEASAAAVPGGRGLRLQRVFLDEGDDLLGVAEAEGREGVGGAVVHRDPARRGVAQASHGEADPG